MKNVLVLIVVGFLIYACSFGAVSGYKSASNPARRDVHVLSENSFHLFSDNHMLSENKLNSDNAGDGGLGTILIAGVCILFVWALGSKKGGNRE